MQEKIKVEQVSISCGGREILKDISLTIKEKQITALIGPSGCGKSTFLKTLNRMNEEECRTEIKGKVFLDGEDIYGPKVNKSLLRKKVGMIFQQPSPFPMSIYDNVAYGPKAHGIRRKNQLDAIVEESLRQAGIWEEVKEKLDRRAEGLSGGQKQRICIARALAVEPEVLLMDEPTSALDPKASEKIEELMVQLKKEHTIVLVTHNLKQAERIADEVVLFMEGKVAEQGNAGQMFYNPRRTATKNYLKTPI